VSFGDYKFDYWCDSDAIVNIEEGGWWFLGYWRADSAYPRLGCADQLQADQ